MVTLINLRFSRIISLLLIMLFFCPLTFGKVVYVDNDAMGANDGTSWENAYVCLQDALADVETGEKPIVIRVAQGIYRPDQHAMVRQDQLRIVSSSDWEATFQLIDGVTIKGGYAGFSEPYPDARDVNLYESVLSGDLNANDGPDFTNIWDNSFHVVTASGTQWTAVLDGFTITGGNADGLFPYDHGGGGINNVEGSPTLINCTLLGNSTTDSGGGMYNSLYSNPALINCTFSCNSADLDGGGMYNNQSDPVLLNCILTENSAGRGGGMCNEKSDPMLTDCTFSENMGGGYGGGGMYNDGGIPMLADCDFVGNSATGSGGAMANYSSDPVLLSCLFRTNSTLRTGGGMYNNDSSPTMTNCLLIGNSAIDGGGMDNIQNSLTTLFNCTFSTNIAESTGGGIHSSMRSLLALYNCILWGDIPDEIEGTPAGAVYSNIQGIWRGEGTGNIDIDPLFADPDNGDYHLKSQAGRWDPDSQSWVFDLVSSPCIDAGNPDTPVGLERFPNGGRINMGAYGGTPEASLSPRQSLPVPGQASDPDPLDGAVGVSRNVILSWTAGFDGASHDVYFGSEFEHVDPSNDNSVLVGNQSGTTYDPGLLEYSRTYYWRVDEVDNQGEIITGAVWSFTTTSGPPKGRACFIGQTGVWIDGNIVPLINVTDEQMIRGLDSLNKIQEVQTHEGTFNCYDILFESGNRITVAENHYFMTESGQWLSLHNLKAGTRLKTLKGMIEIKSITQQSQPYIGKVYNLKIEGSDKYLVGEDAVIVRDY